jgi:hypothetical protein
VYCWEDPTHEGFIRCLPSWSFLSLPTHSLFDPSNADFWPLAPTCKYCQSGIASMCKGMWITCVLGLSQTCIAHACLHRRPIAPDKLAPPSGGPQLLCRQDYIVRVCALLGPVSNMDLAAVSGACLLRCSWCVERRMLCPALPVFAECPDTLQTADAASCLSARWLAPMKASSSSCPSRIATIETNHG